MGSEHCEQPAGYLLGVCQLHLPLLVGAGGQAVGSEHCEQPAGYILGVCQPHLPFLVGAGGQAVGSEQPAGYLLGIGQLHLPLLQDPHRPRHEQEGAGLCHRLPINRYVE